ncbi:hypothetical protein BDW59DRAFT_139849 [Aspergillus cavernicola]|uniref:Uncharacterized protein n=1 Tax=Aspergillus cavernicola TaxID=176166 RepID=A0ABR4IVB4_9EURO
MPFLQSCKIAACGLASCRDRRQTGPKFESRDPGTTSLSKRRFIRLKSWPKSTTPNTRGPKWIRGHKTTSARQQQREGDFADESSDIASEDIPQKIFTYDVMLFGPQREKPVYRRLLLDFQGNLDTLSDDIARLLNLPFTPYNGAEVRLPNGSLVKPEGTLEVKWQLYEGSRPYKTKLLVIKNSDFDMILGISSIQRYKLWEEDCNIQTKLQYHT